MVSDANAPFAEVTTKWRTRRGAIKGKSKEGEKTRIKDGEKERDGKGRGYMAANYMAQLSEQRDRVLSTVR